MTENVNGGRRQKLQNNNPVYNQTYYWPTLGITRPSVESKRPHQPLSKDIKQSLSTAESAFVRWALIAINTGRLTQTRRERVLTSKRRPLIDIYLFKGPCCFVGRTQTSGARQGPSQAAALSLAVGGLRKYVTEMQGQRRFLATERFPSEMLR